MSKTYENAIQSIDEDGEGITITPIDPNLPCGKLKGQTEEEVINDWMETNYPNISDDQLSNMGISVSFTPGEEVYKLYNDDGTVSNVSEEEYNQHISELNTEDGVTANHLIVEGNDSHIDAFNEEGLATEHIGTSHKEPGKIKIHIDSDKMSNYMDDMFETELTREQTTKINQIIEDLTGVKNVISSGMSIKNAYSDILTTLENSDISNKPLRVSGIILSVVLKPTMDVLDLENLWDADSGELTETLNKMAKGGNVIILLVGMTELASGGTASGVLLAAGLICSIVDVAIRDKDEVEIFKLNDKGQIEYDFYVKDATGQKIHYNGVIKLNYNDPQVLINQIYAYLETAKLQLCAELDVLRNKRVDIISQVKSDIEDEMYSLAYGVCVGKWSVEMTDVKTIKALCEIYGAEYVPFATPNVDISYEQNKPLDGLNLLNDVDEIKYKVHISYNASVFTYAIGTAPADSATTSLDEITYEGNLYETRTAVLKASPTIEEIREHSRMYIKSYYQSIHKSNASAKDEYISSYANEDVVPVGKVDYELTGTEEDDVAAEVEKSITNFMSRNRNLLAREVVVDFFNKAIDIANDYASTTDQIETLEKEISSAWKSIYDDRGE